MASINRYLGEPDSGRAGKWFDPTVGKVTFSEYFEKQWLPNRSGEVNTLVYYESIYNSALKPEFRDMQLRRILPSTVQGWVARMAREGVTPGTIKARVKALQTVLAAKRGASALRDRLIESNPVAGVELPTVPPPQVTVYTPPESDRLILAMDPWWRPLPLLAVEHRCPLGRGPGAHGGRLRGPGPADGQDPGDRR